MRSPDATDKDLQRLTPYLETATSLQLQYTKVTDAGLARLPEMNQLNYIDLYQTAITDEGLLHLYKFKALTRIDLNYTKVTAEGVAKLKAALPAARVSAHR